MTTENFKKRQEAAKTVVNALDKADLETAPRRSKFFNHVYQNAGGDAVYVPWADLAPKPEIKAWLEANPGQGKAIDVACGLGDNAEALASAGWETTAFDVSEGAISWAKQRFPNSNVDYRAADLFALPAEWIGKFDVVNECYTLQAMPPETLAQTVPAIASLLAPAGRLLIYTRIRNDRVHADGPPWPLTEAALECFEHFGLRCHARQDFIVEKPGRKIPHTFMEWRKMTS